MNRVQSCLLLPNSENCQKISRRESCEETTSSFASTQFRTFDIKIINVFLPFKRHIFTLRLRQRQFLDFSNSLVCARVRRVAFNCNMASAADRLRDVRYLHTCGERLGLTDEVCSPAHHLHARSRTLALNTSIAFSSLNSPTLMQTWP